MNNVIDIRNKNYDNENEITFINRSYKYCMGIISIVNFIEEKESKNAVGIRKYYSLFFNTMASIIKHYDGKVIKNVGEVYCFIFQRQLTSQNHQLFKMSLNAG
jgi:hypothetical protein